jgi:hypothetical protein
MAAPQRVYNINLSVIGHVDSGKTSLAKALSNQGSTASFDKHPQVFLFFFFFSFFSPLLGFMGIFFL